MTYPDLAAESQHLWDESARLRDESERLQTERESGINIKLIARVIPAPPTYEAGFDCPDCPLMPVLMRLGWHNLETTEAAAKIMVERHLLWAHKGESKGQRDEESHESL